MKTGARHTPEARAKMSLAGAGRPKTAETRAKISAARRGTKATPETRARLSAMARQRPRPTTQTRALISASVLARPVIGPCAYCGDPAVLKDHVIPRGRPGSDDPQNLVPCCNSCNPSKGRRTPEEWKHYLEQRIPRLERDLASMKKKLIAVDTYLKEGAA